MRNRLADKIERHLDRELGIWSRVSPWRAELVGHIEEAYIKRAELDPTSIDEPLLDLAISDFGDVKEVAAQLRKEQLPEACGWRITAGIAAAAVVLGIIGPRTFVDIPSLMIVLVPMIAIAAVDTFRGSTRWHACVRVGSKASLVGALIGAVGILLSLHAPSGVGSFMAISLFSSLYGLLFCAPDARLAIAFLGIALVDLELMNISMMQSDTFDIHSLLLNSFRADARLDASVLQTPLLFAVATMGFGIARTGICRANEYAICAAAATFLFCVVTMLSEMSDPNALGPSLLIGFFAAAIAAIGCIVGAAIARETKSALWQLP